jgi:protein-tyrosine phosphatase
MYYTELLSGIWISDAHILSKPDFFKDNHISIVINCTQLFEFPNIPDSSLKKIRIPFHSEQSDKYNLEMLLSYHQKITSLIHDNMDEHNILICCYDGLSISPMIVALLIVKLGKIDKKSIYDILIGYNRDFSLWCDLAIFD